VVDGNVISRESVCRNAERDRAEGGTGTLLRIRTQVYVGCLQLLQVNARDIFEYVTIFHSNI
jgi:hypothetical protein